MLGGHPGTGAAESLSDAVLFLRSSLGLMLGRHLEAKPRLGSGEGLAQAPGYGEEHTGRGKPGAGGSWLGAAFLAAGFLGLFRSCGGRIRMFSHCVECP
jgi:hypothetical protein